MRHRAATINWSLAVVGVLLLATAVVLSVRAHRRHVALERIDRAFFQAGMNPGQVAPAQSVGPLMGRRDAIAFLTEMDRAFDCFYFDGNSRFCQIHEGGFKYSTSGTGHWDSDALVLTLLSQEELPSAMWYGPPGFEVWDVRFVDGGIEVRAELPDGNDTWPPMPRKFFVPWKPLSAPDAGILDAADELANQAADVSQPDATGTRD